MCFAKTDSRFEVVRDERGLERKNMSCYVVTESNTVTVVTI